MNTPDRPMIRGMPEQAKHITKNADVRVLFDSERKHSSYHILLYPKRPNYVFPSLSTEKLPHSQNFLLR
jgi:hypothetical protein